MDGMAGIDKKRIPRYVVASGFNAFMFEVVKVYCHYPIKGLPDAAVNRPLNGQGGEIGGYSRFLRRAPLVLQ